MFVCTKLTKITGLCKLNPENCLKRGTMQEACLPEEGRHASIYVVRGRMARGQYWCASPLTSLRVSGLAFILRQTYQM